jgi:hypothetical protein
MFSERSGQARRDSSTAAVGAPLAAHCHLGLSKLWARAGQSEQATEHLDAAAAQAPKPSVSGKRAS